MPRGVALWLKTNTKLTLEQISDFTGLNLMIVNVINTDNTTSVNPIRTKQLDWLQIENCEKNSSMRLKNLINVEKLRERTTSGRFISQMQRKKIPDAIIWIYERNNDVDHKKIAQLLKTRKDFVKRTIDSFLLEKSSFNPINPARFGFCSEENVQELIDSK